MVNPKLLCNQHLLGEHVELHMLAGTLKRGKSIKGFLEKGLVDPASITSRHEELVKEMESRGMNHKSPLSVNQNLPHNPINVSENIEELKKRCQKCRDKINRNALNTGG